MKFITRIVDFLLAPIVSRVADAVTRHYDEGRYHGTLIRDDQITDAVRESLDYAALAAEVSHYPTLIDRATDLLTEYVCKDTLTEAIADRLDIKAADIATCVDLGEIAECLDMSDIEDNVARKVTIRASDVAEYMDAYDVASHLDISDIAEQFEVSDIAQHVECDANDVAEHVNIDMDVLAENIVIDDSAMAALGRAIVRSIAGKVNA